MFGRNTNQSVSILGAFLQDLKGILRHEPVIRPARPKLSTETDEHRLAGKMSMCVDPVTMVDPKVSVTKMGHDEPTFLK